MKNSIISPASLIFLVEHNFSVNLLLTNLLWVLPWLEVAVIQVSLCCLLLFLSTAFLSFHLPLHRHKGLMGASPSSQGSAEFPGRLKRGWEREGKNPWRLFLASENSSDYLWLLPRHLWNTFETSPACWAPWLGWRGNPHSLWSLDTWTVLEL